MLILRVERISALNWVAVAKSARVEEWRMKMPGPGFLIMKR
jgi:hypothetical protein